MCRSYLISRSCSNVLSSFKKDLLLITCLHMDIYTWVQVLKEANLLGRPGTADAGGCELLRWVLGSKLSFSAREGCALSYEPAPQPLATAVLYSALLLACKYFTTTSYCFNHNEWGLEMWLISRTLNQHVWSSGLNPEH